MTSNESFIGLPSTEAFGTEEPGTVNGNVFSFYLPGVSGETEQPALLLDADNVHSGLLHLDSIETVTPSSDIQGVIEAETYFKSVAAEEEPLSDNLVPQVPIETFKFHHSLTVAAPSDPVELPLIFPLVHFETAPPVTPISVADLPLETVLPFISTTSSLIPEKVEISSSLEATDHSTAILVPEQGDNVGALPLDLDPKVETQSSSSSVSFDSQIQVDQQPTCHSNTSYDRTTNVNPNEKDSSNRSLGSTPKLRQLGFPPVSNTNDNFNVQVNWTKFM